MNCKFCAVPMKPAEFSRVVAEQNHGDLFTPVLQAIKAGRQPCLKCPKCGHAVLILEIVEVTEQE